MIEHLPHRNKGYDVLKGKGIEVGAFHRPAPVPAYCQIEYCDAIPREDAIKLFSEVNPDEFVEVKHLCDLDKDGLKIFSDGSLDFIILNHVIEHVANPMRVIEELFRVTAAGGHVVLSAPDKEYTFDKKRDLTPFEHLLKDYKDQVTDITDDHYLDFLKGVHPEVFEKGDKEVANMVYKVKARREHAHVWTSESFKEFVLKTFHHLNISADCVFESTSSSNQFEYFSVWRKNIETEKVEKKKKFWDIFKN